MYSIFMRSIGKALVYLCSVGWVGTLVLVLVLFHFWLFMRLPGSSSLDVRELTIEPGTGGESIARSLHAKGVVSDPRLFSLMCWMRGESQKLKAGEYAFLALSTPGQILEQLVSGRVILHKVTFPEGSTVRDVAEILKEKGLAYREEILRLAEDTNTIQSLGISATSLEGYLFPETYHFQRSQNGLIILKAMVDQFRKHLPDGWQERAEKAGLTLHQVVTMASMVEKEAVVDAERPVIAAVFFNRLKRGMLLQSDPTAVYDMADFIGPIESAHLKRQSPYNTYVIKGLPIGPICNPGAESLRAVLFPENVPYLYFVSNDDGTHQFSENIQDHHKAVFRYHRKLKARREEGRSDDQGEAPARQSGGEEDSEWLE